MQRDFLGIFTRALLPVPAFSWSRLFLVFALFGHEMPSGGQLHLHQLLVPCGIGSRELGCSSWMFHPNRCNNAVTLVRTFCCSSRNFSMLESWNMLFLYRKTGLIMYLSILFPSFCSCLCSREWEGGGPSLQLKICFIFFSCMHWQFWLTHKKGHLLQYLFETTSYAL